MILATLDEYAVSQMLRDEICWGFASLQIKMWNYPRVY